MNETVKSILERRSIRKYLSKPVPREYLEVIANCGQFAATGSGKQPWHISVVQNKSLLDKIVKANIDFINNPPQEPLYEGERDYGYENLNQLTKSLPIEILQSHMAQPGFDNFYGAPAAIIISGDISNDSSNADCANATQNMAVAAWSLGIGSCYIASFKMGLLSPNAKNLREELCIPEGYLPIFALSLGYADGELMPRQPRLPDAISWIE